MKFEIKQAIVEFKSNNEFFELEESGLKPNTIRELYYTDVEQALTATHIRIVSANGHTNFERKLTNVCAVANGVIPLANNDRQIVVFSWEHPPTQPKAHRPATREELRESIERCG